MEESAKRLDKAILDYSEEKGYKSTVDHLKDESNFLSLGNVEVLANVLADFWHVFMHNHRNKEAQNAFDGNRSLQVQELRQKGPNTHDTESLKICIEYCLLGRNYQKAAEAFKIEAKLDAIKRESIRVPDNFLQMTWARFEKFAKSGGVKDAEDDLVRQWMSEKNESDWKDMEDIIDLSPPNEGPKSLAVINEKTALLYEGESSLHQLQQTGPALPVEPEPEPVQPEPEPVQPEPELAEPAAQNLRRSNRKRKTSVILIDSVWID